jgi:hypothetical protein
VLVTLANDRTTSWLVDLGHAPSAAEQAAGLVEGFQFAFFVSAALVGIGLAIVALFLRPRDVEKIDTSEPIVVPA